MKKPLKFNEYIQKIAEQPKNPENPDYITMKGKDFISAYSANTQGAYSPATSLPLLFANDSTNIYATFKQIKESQLFLKKGSKARQISFTKTYNQIKPSIKSDEKQFYTKLGTQERNKFFSENPNQPKSKDLYLNRVKVARIFNVFPVNAIQGKPKEILEKLGIPSETITIKKEPINLKSPTLKKYKELTQNIIRFNKEHNCEVKFDSSQSDIKFTGNKNKKIISPPIENYKSQKDFLKELVRETSHHVQNIIDPEGKNMTKPEKEFFTETATLLYMNRISPGTEKDTINYLKNHCEQNLEGFQKNDKLSDKYYRLFDLASSTTQVLNTEEGRKGFDLFLKNKETENQKIKITKIETKEKNAEQEMAM